MVLSALEAHPRDESVEGLENVLRRVQASRGIDFSLYRRGTIERRTEARMRLAGASDYPAYLALLDGDDKEMDSLIAHLTIKVGRFFRDRATFDCLREVVLPALRVAREGKPLRLWSAGCGNGEEAHSLALLLDGLVPPDRDSTILATDVDPRALEHAREGRYRPESLVELAPDFVSAHFETEPYRLGVRYRLAQALRERTSFLLHDLTTAEVAPGGQFFDLILCRNVLIYFGTSLQEKVEAMLIGSLAPGGFLCLGEAEWPAPSLQSALTVVDRQARVFRLAGSNIGKGSNA